MKKPLCLSIILIVIAYSSISAFALSVEEYNAMNDEQREWYNLGNEDGFESGYEVGYDDCYYGEDGYDSGYEDGYSVGFEEGKDEGKDKVVFTILGVLILFGLLALKVYFIG